MSPTWIACALGLAQGMCHAVEPDHLAAVSTFVAAERSPRSVLRFATAWGFGHALVLFFVGGSLLVLGARMPASLSDVFELGVALMLALLGLRAIFGRPIPHAHGPRSVPTHRAGLVGMVHGLAGSGAIAAVVAARLLSPVEGLVFIVLYGLGATLGMSIIAAMAYVPLARLSARTTGRPYLVRATGIVTLVVAAAWAWPIAQRWVS